MHPAVLAASGDKTNNFLIPNGTFIFEWIVFGVILWVIWKKILPLITGRLEERQEAIRKQFDDAERAREEAERSQQEYREALAETRKEISRLREEANAEKGQILEEARAEAAAYREEQMRVLDERLATERQQILLSLRSEVGELAFALSEKIVHESLRDDERQRRLVDDFIAGVDAGVGAAS